MLRSGVVAIMATAVLLAGCSGGKVDSRISGRSLTIYSSLPMEGVSRSSAVAIVRGARLALDATGGRIGRYRIVYRALDDSTAKAQTWDPNQTTINARLAADDRTTVGYIGDFDSAASAISIPILNRVGIAQVSPSNTAIGLTTDAPGAAPGEPDKYYPTRRRTYARLVASDAVQAAAQIALQRHEGCTATAVLDDQDPFGEGLTIDFQRGAPRSGLRITDLVGFDPKAADFRSLAAAVARTRPDCVFVRAFAVGDAGPLAAALAQAMPDAKLFSSDDAVAAARDIPRLLDPRVFLTVAPLDHSQYPPPGRAFVQRYVARYGRLDAYAVYGYEAMRLLLDAVRAATGDGHRIADRARVVAAVFATRERTGAIGTYSIERDGDTTLNAYGAYRLEDGVPRYVETWRVAPL